MKKEQKITSVNPNNSKSSNPSNFAEIQQAVLSNLDKLTAKNSDYIHTVTRQLMLSGKTDSEVKNILFDILPQILEAQKDGTTARHLLGTPTDFISHYKSESVSKDSTEYSKNPWLMWIDNVLNIFGLLAIINGLMVTFSQGVTTYGLTFLILSSLAGGGSMYIIYQVSDTEKESNKTPPFRGYRVVMMAVATLIWLVVTFFSLLLPPSINPKLNGITLIVSGVVIFGVRYVLRKKFKIQSSIFSRDQ